MNRFTERAQKVISIAQEEAKRLNHDYVGTEHLLLGLVALGEGVAAQVLANLGIDFRKLRNEVEKVVGTGDNIMLLGEIPFSSRAKKVLELSVDEAGTMGHYYVGTEHLLLGLLKEEEGIAARVLENLGVKIEDVKEEVVNLLGEPTKSQQNQHPPISSGGHRVSNKTKTKTPTLDEFSRDLTVLAKEGGLDPVIGRDNEIERLTQILSRRTKNNPVLIGDPGVGKTAIVEGLAQRIAKGETPEILNNKRVITLDLSAVVAGTKYRGEFEQRLKNIMDEIRRGKNSIILFIDELHTVIGAGAAEGAIDASNMLKPALARGELQCIGATTLDEYRKHIEHDPALERRFQPIVVDPSTVEDTIAILKGLKEKYESHHKVKYTDEALATAAYLSDRFISDRYLPDKAIDIIDEAGSRARLQVSQVTPEIKEKEEELEAVIKDKESSISKQAYEKAARLRDKEREMKRAIEEMKKKWREKRDAIFPPVTEDDIAYVISKWTNIPITRITEKEQERLLKMEDELHGRVIGQDEAIRSISQAIRRSRTGLKDPKKPIGSFIFLGPTGVGKTELARTLAEFLFGDDTALIRIDMSEYMEKFSVSRLIGAPPGYVGYEEGGQLTEKVRRRPYAVVLLDEIEKAHAEVYNLLLQIFEEGNLTDSLGHKVSFKNTIIIMTSNVGARLISKGKALGFLVQEDSQRTYVSIKDTILEEVKKTFNPEFINRIDDMIVFHPIGKPEMKKILDLLLERVKIKLEKQGLTIELSETAKEFLLENGFDSNYGARPLQRTIQRHLEDAISEDILSKNVVAGPAGNLTKIYADFDQENKKIKFISNVIPVVKKNLI
ncbi:MAG: ATP-dependent Clp protease ATP-binding subunit [Elusimicrobia bacterium]|nr:ATP-dependent Clp protease ATP-binding subunit [Elusimicrobiota bacterium]MBU2614585.1 ATP-dependent Clp protease ATP-binding subunit [Elusimicrobiota bacterium]